MLRRTARRERGTAYGPKLRRAELRGFYKGFAIAQGVLNALRVPAASGSNMLVAARALAAVGGFDTALTCNEDSELGWRIARAGFAHRFEPGLVVYATDHRRLRRGRLRKAVHTVLRCMVLYFNLVPRRWRRHDWGYWSEPSS